MEVCYECRSIKVYIRSIWKCILCEDSDTRMLETFAYKNQNDIKFHEMNAKLIYKWHEFSIIIMLKMMITLNVPIVQMPKTWVPLLLDFLPIYSIS